MTLEQKDRFEIEARGATDVGMKRRLNEDVFVLDNEHGVFLVADGMGNTTIAETLNARPVIRNTRPNSRPSDTSPSAVVWMMPENSVVPENP